MKKVSVQRRILIAIFVSFIVVMISQNELKAQLKIHDNGVTTINYPNGTGAAKFFSYYTGDDTFGRAIYGNSPARAGKYNIGVMGYSLSATPVGSGESYGVYGLAGNSTSGKNYGVTGNLYGSQNGAGVYGTTGNILPVVGRYAGYFEGNTKINGTLYLLGNPVITSDIRAKKEIKSLEKGNTSKLKSINAISYKLKTPAELNASAGVKTINRASLNAVNDTSAAVQITPEQAKHYNKNRIGLSAQEVREVYPDLVEENENGDLGVDYIGLIPVLIEAIKEQQLALEIQQAEIARLTKKVNGKVK